MNVLEKILEEIGVAERIRFSKYIELLIAVKDVEKIIRSHMDDQNGDITEMVGNWIPVEDRLPEVNKTVKVTVHSSEWISDFDSSWVPEEEKRRHPEAYKVYDGYIDESGKWVFIDEEFSENICEGSFGEDKGRIYDVVIAWQPLPEPYRPEDIQEASSCFCSS